MSNSVSRHSALECLFYQLGRDAGYARMAEKPSTTREELIDHIMEGRITGLPQKRALVVAARAADRIIHMTTKHPELYQRIL